MYRKYLKRIFDLIVSLVSLPFFIILLIPISVLIFAEDRGPIFYNGERIGKDNKIFKMYKFRSMKVNSPDVRNNDGSTFNSKDDMRVTKVGKFLRETSLDEVPQIVNVLKGEMSLIGPRASLASALGSYEADELDKMRIRPGITGYCQAYFRNGLNVREKRLKDAWYAKELTFLLDLKILFKTIETVLKREKLYTNEEQVYIDFNHNTKQDADI